MKHSCRLHVRLAVAIAAAVTHPKCEAFAPPMPAATPLGYQHSTASRPSLQLQALSLFPDNRKQQKRKMGLYSSPSSSDQETDKIYYIRPYLKQLFLICRPVNFPIVAIFHVLGVHQAVRLWEANSSSSSSLLLPLLKHPSMLMVLLALLLVTSTSMITNDYYDARNGVDSTYSDASDDENDHYHPLARGEVPFSITKTFDSYLYAILLLSSAFVPGVISRLMVLGGAIITYLYTVHLKPRTWIKNLSCAALVAMSPVTSGLAAWSVLCGGFGAGDAAVVSTLIFKGPLSFLVVSLFAGILSREILMDITDCEGDAQAGIATVPVRYGKKVASRVALGCSFVSSASACGASMAPCIRKLVQGGESLSSLIAMPSISSLPTLLTNHGVRKIILSVAGSGLLLMRAFQVWRTNGEDADFAEQAVRESLFSVLLVLASFI